MNRRTCLSLVAATSLTLALAACSGEPESAGTPSPTVSATPSSATPSATPAPTKPPAAPARTAAQLTKALLALDDLPAGFSIETDAGDEGEGEDGKLSSKDPKCARLVALSNADQAPGSKAGAYRSFSGGDQGPFIDESLDALGSAAAVQALQQSFRQAIQSCRGMSLTIPGEGRSPITVREVSAPKAGTTPVAVRYSASSGPLEGLEVTMVTTGVQDVVVSVTVMAGLPDEVDGATRAAVAKATKVLGGTTGT